MEITKKREAKTKEVAPKKPKTTTPESELDTTNDTFIYH
jgi:hypothetical protein